MNASSNKSEGHTPGPWTAELGDQTRTSEIWAGDMIVADVHGHVTRGCHADARLIAAAPDLLAALRDLVDVMTGRMTGEATALHNAIAAITKASGPNHKVTGATLEAT